jgi:hypothetical protein
MSQKNDSQLVVVPSGPRELQLGALQQAAPVEKPGQEVGIRQEHFLFDQGIGETQQLVE